MSTWTLQIRPEINKQHGEDRKVVQQLIQAAEDCEEWHFGIPKSGGLVVGRDASQVNVYSQFIWLVYLIINCLTMQRSLPARQWLCCLLIKLLMVEWVTGWLGDWVTGCQRHNDTVRWNWWSTCFIYCSWLLFIFRPVSHQTFQMDACTGVSSLTRGVTDTKYRMRDVEIKTVSHSSL